MRVSYGSKAGLIDNYRQKMGKTKGCNYICKSAIRAKIVPIYGTVLVVAGYIWNPFICV